MLLKWRIINRQHDLAEVDLPIKGRLKELWKPILQVTQGLTVHDSLFKFVEDQKNERLSSKQNSLEGHVIKVVVVDLYNEAEEQVSCLPFQKIDRLFGAHTRYRPLDADTSSLELR